MPTNYPFFVAPIRTAIRAAVFYIGPQQFEIVEAQVSHDHYESKNIPTFL
jgi:hypothetical protein